MSTSEQTAGVSWRLATPADVPFLYRLIAAVDPRWYRFSRDGLDPRALLGLIGSVAGGAIVFDADGRPVAGALLADATESGTGTFEYHALPDPHAERCATLVAPALLAAVFEASAPRRLYIERFDNDPMLLGEVAHLFEPEVILPDFLRIDGRYEARTTSVLTADAWWAWCRSHGEAT